MWIGCGLRKVKVGNDRNGALIENKRCTCTGTLIFVYNALYSTSLVLMTLAVFRLPASGDFCHLLIIFSNNLDTDRDGHNIDPDLYPNCWTSDSVPK